MPPKRTTIKVKNARLESNPNDLWDHAIPLEGKRKEIDLIAEAKFMRELYLTNLPGEIDRDNVNAYFDRLDESIKSGTTVPADDFPDEPYDDNSDEGKSIQDDDDSSSYNPSPKDRQYWYYSADLFKERARGYSLQSSGEDMDHPTVFSPAGGAAHDEHPVAADLPPISERTDGEDSEDEWLS